MDKRKKTLIKVGSGMIIILGAIVGYYIFNNYFYVTTEDAHVTADIVRINSQITGKLVSSELEEGTIVKKDQIVGRQEAPNQTDTGLEQSLLRAPIDGVVIKKQGSIGEIIPSGQAVGMLVDLKKLYIVANIEETKLGNVKAGEMVDVRIDQYPGQKLVGKISQIGEASNSTFSLLSSSGSGTFTKVIQKVAVKIVLDSGSIKLLPGTNAVVKIHIR